MCATTAIKAVIGKYLERCARDGGGLGDGARSSDFKMLTFDRAAQCKEEVTSRRKEISEGRCFTCGEKGHKRSDCPSDNSSTRRSDRPSRRKVESRSRSRSPRRKYRRRSPSYSDSDSRSSSYSRYKRRSSRRNRKSYSYSRSSSPVRRSRSGRHEERRRTTRRKRYSSSRSVSPKAVRAKVNTDNENTAVTAKTTG